MTDRYVSLAGPTMHTGWMKKISILEQQMVAAVRNIALLEKRVKTLEEAPVGQVSPDENYNRISESPLPTAVSVGVPKVTLYVDNAPPKRGPGRPRKNPPA